MKFSAASWPKKSQLHFSVDVPEFLLLVGVASGALWSLPLSLSITTPATRAKNMNTKINPDRFTRLTPICDGETAPARGRNAGAYPGATSGRADSTCSWVNGCCDDEAAN